MPPSSASRPRIASLRRRFTRSESCDLGNREGVFQQPARSISATEREILRNLHIESRRYVAPIYWSSDPYDANTVKNNGSCFAIEIDGLHLGVTAQHVVAAYLAARDMDSSTQLMIRNTPIDNWAERFIDGDEGLDLATFRLTAAEIEQISFRPFVHTAQSWPPPPPKLGATISMTGYPGIDRNVVDRRTVEFLGISHVVVVTNIDPDCLEIKMERNDLTNLDGTPIQSLEYDFGGFSGAPVLIESGNVGALFRLGGLVIKQWPPGGSRDTTTILARRPDCIRPNGTFIRPNFTGR
ncbi:MAG: hypothetical protein ACKO1J_05235 [Tagaea sp.]